MTLGRLIRPEDRKSLSYQSDLPLSFHAGHTSAPANQDSQCLPVPDTRSTEGALPLAGQTQGYHELQGAGRIWGDGLQRRGREGSECVCPIEPVRTGRRLRFHEVYTLRKEFHRKGFVPFLIKILRTLLCSLLCFSPILRALCPLIHCSVSS